MILTRKIILDEIKNKKMKIEPFNMNNLGPASYDLTLDNRFWFFNSKEIRINENSNANDYTSIRRLKNVRLLPGEFVLGITKEKITLPENISALLSGRSRFARFGLSVDTTSFFIQPGVKNRQIFEIRNNSSNILVIPAGLKIAQLIFVRTEGESKYNGRFKTQ